MKTELNLSRADLQLLVSSLSSYVEAVEESCEQLESTGRDIGNQVKRLLAVRALRRRLLSELERTAPALSWTNVEA